MENGRNNSGIIVLVVILSLLVLGLGSYIVYDKVFSKETKNDDKQNNNEVQNDNIKISNNTYNAGDYIVVSDFEFNKSCIDCGTYGTVKKIEFKKLPLGTTVEFMNLHENFIYPTAFETGKLTNTVTYGTSNNVFSVYTIEEKKYELNTEYNNYSLNVNLDNNRIITNEELIGMYDLDIDSIYEKILNNLTTTVTTDKFLLSVDGDVSAETISVADFKNKISDYVETLNNRYDVFTLYVKDNKVNLVYSQGGVLQLLGMGTHMGIGLAKDQTLILN